MASCVSLSHSYSTAPACGGGGDGGGGDGGSVDGGRGYERGPWEDVPGGCDYGRGVWRGVALACRGEWGLGVWRAERVWDGGWLMASLLRDKRERERERE